MNKSDVPERASPALASSFYITTQILTGSYRAGEETADLVGRVLLHGLGNMPVGVRTCMVTADGKII